MLSTTLNSRLERIYQTSHTHAWNGPEVVRQAAKNRSDLKALDSKPLAQFASFMMAVELTSWNQSLRLASILKSMEARLAATAQAADEANHYVTVREYLSGFGFEHPLPINTRLAGLLDEIEHTVDPATAFLQLHLIVENVTTIIFKKLAKKSVDVVLSKVMPYYLRDESRHVTFAKLYISELISPESSEEIDKWATLWASTVREAILWLKEDHKLFEALELPVDSIIDEMLEVEPELVILSPVFAEIIRKANTCEFFHSFSNQNSMEVN